MMRKGYAHVANRIIDRPPPNGGENAKEGGRKEEGC
jgi:hypothetical protein